MPGAHGSTRVAGDEAVYALGQAQPATMAPE